MNRNIILGREWLKQNGVRIYFDLGYLRIRNTYIRLEEDIHISSLLRLARKTNLKPQTATVCTVKVNKGFNLSEKSFLEISAVDSGYISSEPGLEVCKSISKVTNSRKFPVMIINNTNDFFKLKRGEVVGKGGCLSDQDIKTFNINEINVQDKCNFLTDLNVPDEFRPDIERLVVDNRDLFAQNDCELGHTDTVKMKIDTGDHPPIKKRPYRLPINKRPVVEKCLKEMLDSGIIERSRSPWSFPLVVVDKKDGSKRMCVDFRSLNKILRPVSFPLPLIDDILSLLVKAKYFSALDLRSGYWQVLLEEKDKEKTAFACHKGLFQFKVMPFGISTAPSLFQELANIVLQGAEDYAIAY